MSTYIPKLLSSIAFYCTISLPLQQAVFAQQPMPTPPPVVIGMTGYACYNTGLVSGECDTKANKVNEGFTVEKIAENGDRISNLKVTGADGNYQAQFLSKINYKSADGPAFVRDTSAYLSVTILLLDDPKNNYKVNIAPLSSSKVTTVRPPTNGMFGCPCNSAAAEANIMEGKSYSQEGPISAFPGNLVVLTQYPEARYKIVYSSEVSTMVRGLISNWDFDAGLFAEATLSLKISATATNIEPDLKILDPACGGTVTCNGEYLEFISGGVKLKSKEKLIQANVEREGIVTDGVSKLLIRTPSNAALTFSLKDPEGNPVTDPKYGILTTRDGARRGFSLTVSPEEVSNKNYVFAVYETPIHYPGKDGTQSTQLTLETSYNLSGNDTPFVTPKKITLAPPPVLLIHGIWADSSVWTNPRPGFLGEQGFYSFLKNNGYKPYLVDYSPYPTNAYSFTDSRVQLRLVRTIDRAFKDQRFTGRAISQVDIVAHSMGGLVSRAREGLIVAPIRPYRRLDNYLQGEFHKL